MSLDWQILEENKKKWYKKGFWRGILLSTFLILIFLFFFKNINLSSNFPHIARIEINGLIFDNNDLIKTFDEMLENDNVKAVFVKINSPGGTVVGSESLYLVINRLSKTKPVIALMGEIATSGGYVVALASNYILARQNTLTGSIGVIVEYQNFSELSKKIGIKVDSIKSGDIKGGQNPLSPLNPLVKMNDKKIVDYSFNWFLSLVRKNRDIDQKVIDFVSDGKTITGGMAKDLGLIDEIGAEREALNYLKKNNPEFTELNIIDIETSSKGDLIFERFLNNYSNLNNHFLYFLTNSLKLISIAR